MFARATRWAFSILMSPGVVVFRTRPLGRGGRVRSSRDRSLVAGKQRSHRGPASTKRELSLLWTNLVTKCGLFSRFRLSDANLGKLRLLDFRHFVGAV